MEKLDISTKALAKIAKGTKRKRKYVNELEVAQELNSIYLRCNSLAKLAEIVKLSPEMVRQIKSLVTLQDEVKSLYRKGSLKGYDIGYRISKLKKNDQAVLANHVLSNKLSSDDVRSIVKHRSGNPKLSIQRVINEVIRSKDRKVYVAYLGIEEETFEKLLKNIKKGDQERILKRIFKNTIDERFLASFELNGRVAIIKVHKQGLQHLRNSAKRLGVPLAKLADALVREYLEVVND